MARTNSQSPSAIVAIAAIMSQKRPRVIPHITAPAGGTIEDYEALVAAAEAAAADADQELTREHEVSPETLVSNVLSRDCPTYACLLCGTGVRDARALFKCRCELWFHVACMRIHMRTMRACPCCRREVRTLPPPDAVERCLYGPTPKADSRTSVKRHPDSSDADHCAGPASAAAAAAAPAPARPPRR